MPYFMLRSAQKAPLADRRGGRGVAGVKVSAGDSLRLPPGLEGGGTQLRWHGMVQNRKLSVTGFLLGKGSSSQGSVSRLEWKDREMEPQVTVFSQGHIFLAPNQQFSIQQ